MPSTPRQPPPTRQQGLSNGGNPFQDPPHPFQDPPHPPPERPNLTEEFLGRLGEAGGTGPDYTRLASLALGCCDSLQHAERPPLAGGSRRMTSTSGEAPTSKGSPVRLQPSKQLVIGRMRANPKPDDFIGAPNPHSTVPSAHPHRINRLGGMHMLPAETRMRRVLPEEFICFPCLLLYLRRQSREHGTKRLRDMGDHNRSGSSTCVLPAWCSASA